MRVNTRYINSTRGTSSKLTPRYVLSLHERSAPRSVSDFWETTSDFGGNPFLQATKHLKQQLKSEKWDVGYLSTFDCGVLLYCHKKPELCKSRVYVQLYLLACQLRVTVGSLFFVFVCDSAQALLASFCFRRVVKNVVIAGSLTAWWEPNFLGFPSRVKGVLWWLLVSIMRLPLPRACRRLFRNTEMPHDIASL